MSSWKALDWARERRVGSHVRKLLLVLMCEKVNERFELYPARKQLAHECEIATSTLVEHQRALDEAGLITVIERVRTNGAQGRTTVAINHPAAPHMNGKPIVLDFEGKHLYPKYPDKLRAAGIQWISGGELGAVLPGTEPEPEEEPEEEPGDVSPSHDGGPGAGPQGVREPDGGGPGAGPHGGPGAGPLIFPTDPPTTSQGGDAAASQAGGRFDQDDGTPGARLLRSLPLPRPISKKAISTWTPFVNELLESGWTTEELAHELAGNLPSDLRSPTGLVVDRLKGLSPKRPTNPLRVVLTAEEAEARITKLSKDEKGCRELARLIGAEWLEPERRPDETAKEYYYETRPAAVRAWVATHHDQLITALTGANAA